jgi:predicted RNA-binding Zn ribbon-like protein
MEKTVPKKPGIWRFHLTGGALCLDFANTLSWRRGSSPIERLAGYEDLIAFGLQAAVIDAAEARALRATTTRQPRRATRVHKDALELRALIDRIFTKIVEGRVADRVDVAALNERLAEVAARMRVVPDRRGYVWHDIGETLDGMLAPIVRSAATLLTSVELAKLHRCAADDCGWLFIDLSRNQNRRWCDMRVCGNRAKARRHFHRAQRAVATHLKTSDLPRHKTVSFPTDDC